MIDIQEKGESKPAKSQPLDIEKKKSLLSSESGKYKNLDINALEELLEDAVKNEEYEKASMIRDEIEKRKK